MTIKRIEPREIRRAGRLESAADIPPAGIPPLLRASWKFARDMARRFARELMSDRTEEFLKNIVKRFR